MPIHIAGPVTPVDACTKNVSHKKAPGAIRAIAFIVRPVRPSVACISPVVFFSAICDDLLHGSSVPSRGHRSVVEGQGTDPLPGSKTQLFDESNHDFEC